MKNQLDIIINVNRLGRSVITNIISETIRGTMPVKFSRTLTPVLVCSSIPNKSMVQYQKGCYELRGKKRIIIFFLRYDFFQPICT